MDQIMNILVNQADDFIQWRESNLAGVGQWEPVYWLHEKSGMRTVIMCVFTKHYTSWKNVTEYWLNKAFFYHSLPPKLTFE